MARFVDADALLESEIRRCGRVPTIGTGYINEKNFESVLEETTTVDAVEVVRCRECKYHEDTSVTEYEHCCLLSKTVRYNDFCSYGERKEGDGNGLF